MNLFANGTHEDANWFSFVDDYLLEGLIWQSDAERAVLFLEHKLFLNYIYY